MNYVDGHVKCDLIEEQLCFCKELDVLGTMLLPGVQINESNPELLQLLSWNQPIFCKDESVLRGNLFDRSFTVTQPRSCRISLLFMSMDMVNLLWKIEKMCKTCHLAWPIIMVDEPCVSSESAQLQAMGFGFGDLTISVKEKQWCQAHCKQKRVIGTGYQDVRKGSPISL